MEVYIYHDMNVYHDMELAFPKMKNEYKVLNINTKFSPYKVDKKCLQTKIGQFTHLCRHYVYQDKNYSHPHSYLSGKTLTVMQGI